jgi:hypothetical protein
MTEQAQISTGFHPLVRRGMIVGAILGYPVSYFLQSSMVRAKLSLPQYIVHVGDVLAEGELVGAVVLGFIVSIGAGAAIGYFMSKQA